MEQDKLIELLAKTLESVAASLAGATKTLETTRTELDALRTVFIATLVHLSADPPQATALAQVIRETIEREAAFALNTTMSDAMLQARREWMQKLLPSNLLPLVPMP